MNEQANTPQKKRSNYLTNEQSLNNYDVIFTNIFSQPLILQEMAEFGYDEAKINEGKALAETARKAYADNKRETAESVGHAMCWTKWQKAFSLRFRIIAKWQK